MVTCLQAPSLICRDCFIYNEHLPLSLCFCNLSFTFIFFLPRFTPSFFLTFTLFTIFLSLSGLARFSVSGCLILNPQTERWRNIDQHRLMEEGESSRQKEEETKKKEKEREGRRGEGVNRMLTQEFSKLTEHKGQKIKRQKR